MESGPGVGTLRLRTSTSWLVSWGEKEPDRGWPGRSQLGELGDLLEEVGAHPIENQAGGELRGSIPG